MGTEEKGPKRNLPRNKELINYLKSFERLVDLLENFCSLKKSADRFIENYVSENVRHITSHTYTHTYPYVVITSQILIRTSTKLVIQHYWEKLLVGRDNVTANSTYFISRSDEIMSARN